MKIAAVQMEAKAGRIQNNIEKIHDFVGKNKDADIIIFPELAVSGYCTGEFHKFAAEIGKDIYQELAKIARKHSVYLGCGFLEKENENIYNSYLVFDKAGELVAKYRKIHLINEFDKGLTEGNDIIVFETGFGRVGIAICYDLRFPELWRGLMRRDAEVVFLPSQWPKKRIEHWNVLLKARAIENQFFVVGANGAGKSSEGETQVISPDGKIISRLNDKESVLKVEIDLKEVNNIREAFPCLEDIREDF
ncbi:MAG: nitrilase-related carbon-nitrogen hydrolase [archaeon]|nr:nitrilase-related carbon-nitrogen hydrolase [archaeon]